MQRSFNLEQAPRIDLHEAKAEFDRGAALFVDVRRPEEYQKCHIPGAISVPLREIRQWAEELRHSPSVITYCT